MKSDSPDRLLGPEDHFLLEMETLAHFEGSYEHRDLVTVAGAVYKLLLDGHPLSPQVRKLHPSVPLPRFRVSRDSVTDQELVRPSPGSTVLVPGTPEGWVTLRDSLDPEADPGKGEDELPLEEFLAHPVGLTAQERPEEERTAVSMKDAVVAVRHLVYGHAGKANNDAQRAVIKLALGEAPAPESGLVLLRPEDDVPPPLADLPRGYGGLLVTIGAVGRITRRALDPLKAAVEASRAE